MWPVTRPAFDAGETFQTCISRIRDRTAQRRLASVRPQIEAASADYEDRAEAGELHLIRTSNSIAGVVTSAEMSDVYDQRMARKTAPGRGIYDKLKMLPYGDRCPFCDQRNVSTLDHLLPKMLYPAFAVTPLNLVGVCMECNKLKLDVAPSGAEDTFLHPYFDDISQSEWLIGTVVHQIPCAVTFGIARPAGFSATLYARMRHQFSLLGLATLYSREAAREISNIRHNLQTHFDTGGSQAVRGELVSQWRSRRANRLNSWQTATYKALAHDNWFYNGGFT